MAQLTSFYDWLTKQKSLRTALGEFARTAARDPSFPRDVASVEALLEHVRGPMKASPQTVVVARTAYQNYVRSQKPPASL